MIVDTVQHTVFVFGNEFLEEDSFAHEVAQHLTDVRLVYCRSPDDLLDAEGKVVILDVVKGAKQPLRITDIAQLKTRNLMSLHDFDVGFFLNLMKGMGLDVDLTIIGIPAKGDAEDIARQVRPWI